MKEKRNDVEKRNCSKWKSALYDLTMLQSTKSRVEDYGIKSYEGQVATRSLLQSVLEIQN